MTPFNKLCEERGRKNYEAHVKSLQSNPNYYAIHIVNNWNGMAIEDKQRWCDTAANDLVLSYYRANKAAVEQAVVEWVNKKEQA